MKAQLQRIGFVAVALAGMAYATAALADDAANQKIIDYYRRKSNLPPEVTVTVTNVTDAKIPGAKLATLTLSRGGQTQTQEFLMSADGKYVVFAEVEDVTSDPFKAIAAKIKTEGSPVRGPKDAKVTIVEFSDFQCPYCARAHQTMSEQVMKEYDGKVKLVYKNFPLGFHQWAEPAAIGGACAAKQDQAAFWTLLRLHVQQPAADHAGEREGQGAGGAQGHQGRHGEVERLLRQQEDPGQGQGRHGRGRSVGVTGTPAFIINGRKISGAQPFQNFKAVIDDELARSGKS